MDEDIPIRRVEACRPRVSIAHRDARSPLHADRGVKEASLDPSMPIVPGLVHLDSIAWAVWYNLVPRVDLAATMACSIHHAQGHVWLATGVLPPRRLPMPLHAIRPRSIVHLEHRFHKMYPAVPIPFHQVPLPTARLDLNANKAKPDHAPLDW